LKLAIDVEPTGRDGSGNDTYLRGLVKGLTKSLSAADTMFLIGGSASFDEEAPPRIRHIPHPSGILGDLTMGLRMQALRADVAVGSYNAPLGFAKFRATIIHDAASRRLPSTFPPNLRRRIDWSIRRSIRLSDLIITISAFSKRELLSLYPSLTADDVFVTPIAPDEIFYSSKWFAATSRFKARFSLPHNFILAVGNLQPRKNLIRLSDAAAAINVPLVLVGRPIWGGTSTLGELQARHVRWLGYVTREELAGLYSACTVFAYPSLYEGFGLPIIEAMAAGAPVITSNSTACAETAGDAAVLVDPMATESLVEGLKQVLGDDGCRQTMSRAGVLRSRSFNWDDSANALLTHFAQVCPDRNTAGTFLRASRSFFRSGGRQ
jgi:glycosyltransferase involved in cell wall biosynthesis